MNITANGHELVAEARELLAKARFGISHPLMVDGESRFRRQSGQYMTAMDVLQEHFKMQKALADATCSLDAALREISKATPS